MRASLRRLAAAGLLLAALSPARAQVQAAASFKPLDVDKLLAQAKDYRRRAALLRQMIGVRESRISAIERQANAVVAQAQSDAQARKATADQAASSAQGAQAAASIFGAILNAAGVNNNLADVANGVAQGAARSAANNAAAMANGAAGQNSAEMSEAQKEAASLSAQAKSFEGEKKKMAFTALRYEQLADSKELLAAAEILRLKAEGLGDFDKQLARAVSADGEFVKSLTLR